MRRSQRTTTRASTSNELEALASEERVPSGDEIASEIERYLKEQT